MKPNPFFIIKPGLHRIVAILVLLFPLIVYGQQQTIVGNASKPFATITSTDATNTYFSADLTLMPTFFERAYFLDAVFSDPKLVVNNSNISGESILLFSNKEYDAAKVLETLQSFHDKAIEAGKTFPPAKKNELLKKYEKFR
jgi:hypothetical protein